MRISSPRAATLLGVAACLGAALAALAPRPAAAASDVLPRLAAAARTQAALPPAEGAVIVRFRPGAGALRAHPLLGGERGEALARVLERRAAALGARQGVALANGGALAERMQVVRASGVDAAALAQRLAADPDVEFAVPDGRMRRLAAPNDPLYAATTAEPRPNGVGNQNGPLAGQWYLRAPDATFRSAIDIERAWVRTRGSISVVVAVLDTGVRLDHPDLAGRLLAGYDFVSNVTVANDGNGRDSDPSDPGDWITSADAATSTFTGCEPSPSSWHGTATSSLVGAGTDNAVGMAGAAPGVRVLPIRVLGKCFGNDSDIIAGMRWAAGLSVAGVPDNPNPARVLNLSLGGGGACSAAYQTAVNEIVARGVMIVAAAGNSAGEPVGSPANCQGVVAVAALRHAGTKVGFSDLGPQIAIAAPGGNCINIRAGQPCLYPILAASDTGTQGPRASSWTDSFDVTVGTSFSSPLVAAVAGLIWSERPGIEASQVLALMRFTSRGFPRTGADNGPDDPTPVTQCQAPRNGVTQLQCYCTTEFCGAGMLDAGAALDAARASASSFTSINSPGTAFVGRSFTLSASPWIADPGTTITSYRWTIVDDAAGVGAFSSASNADTVSFAPTRAGSMRVRLEATDSRGSTSVAEIGVIAAQSTTSVPNPPPGGGGFDGGGDSGGGGGAFGGFWLLLLALAVGALRRGAPSRRG